MLLFGKYILIVIVAVLMLCVLSYISVPVYDFQSGRSFCGDSVYNPYAGADSSCWRKANFHAHQKEKPQCDYTVEQMLEAYRSNGYDIMSISDHQCLNTEHADRPGFTMSERSIGKTFENLFDKGADKRIIIATFASNVHRVQQIINSAHTHGRKVAVTGRSMVNVLNAAIELGYMSIPKNTLIDLDEVDRYPKDKIVIVTTGSQGESMSALTRMAFSIHKKINIEPTDMVIISASPIPGNEKTVSNVVNELLKHGAEVVYERQDNVHVSGHACQQEQRIILALAKPKYFIPVHGEYRHLSRHKELALQTGIPSKNVFISDIGKIMEISSRDAKFVGTVPSGKVLVDGLGVGDVGNIVLRDRKHLSEDGIIIVVVSIEKTSSTCVSGPDVISRGFVYVRESEDLMESIRSISADIVEECTSGSALNWTVLKTRIKNDVGSFLYSKTKRRPMILPIIMEV